MCYTAGPRCSPHALKKLYNAKARFNQIDPTDIDKIEEAKQKLAIAQEEYLTSPAGIKKLRAKAEETGDKKYAAKADKYAANRKAQIAVVKELEAAKNKSVADALAAKTSTQNPTDEATRQAEIKNYLTEKRKLSKEFSDVERFNVSESLYYTKINSEYEYDDTQCGPDGICNAGDDYCRDSEYVNLRVNPDSINTRKTLGDIYGYAENIIPDELETIGRDELDLDNPESYDTESEYGYYGVEGARITLSNPSKVQNRLKEYYDSKYQEIQAKDDALDAKTPKDIKEEAFRPAPSKPKVKRVASKAPTARAARKPRAGTSKAPAPATKPQRRERTAAELDAFERDEMTPMPVRKATAPKKPVATPPKRRERTAAELDAFERDEMTPRPVRKATAPKKPVATPPKRRERTAAELDAFERDERN